MADDRYGERQLEILRTIHGPSSPQVAARLLQAVQAALAAEDWPVVLSLGREGLKVRAALCPQGDADTVRLLSGVGRALARRNELDGARGHLGQAVQLGRKLDLGRDVLAADLLALARVLQQQGELARARAHAAEAGELLAAGPGGEPTPLSIEVEVLQLELAAQAGEGEQALAHLQRLQELGGPGPGPGPGLIPALEEAARGMAGKGQLTQARQAVEAALALLRAGGGAPAPADPGDGARPGEARLLSLLGDIQRRGDDLAAARASWEEALQLELAAHGEESGETAILQNNLGALLWDMGLHAEGYELVRRANRTFCELHGFVHPHTQASGRALIQMRAWLEEQEAERRRR